MNFSLPEGTIAVLPATRLDKIRRYQECIANFACEIRGRDVDRCIQAISPMTHELENMKDGSYRVHKLTEPQARLIQQQVLNWVASSPESRVVQAYPVSTDHSCQQAKDSTNPALTGTSAAQFNGGVALSGGPWSVTVETNDDGSVAAVHIHGPGKEKETPVAKEIVPHLTAAPKVETKELKKENVEEEQEKTAPSPQAVSSAPKAADLPKRATKLKPSGSTRKRPTKKSK